MLNPTETDATAAGVSSGGGRTPTTPARTCTTRWAIQLQRQLHFGERAIAELKQRWRTLQHVTLSPNRIGADAQVAVVLNEAWGQSLREPQCVFPRRLRSMVAGESVGGSRVGVARAD